MGKRNKSNKSKKPLTEKQLDTRFQKRYWHFLHQFNDLYDIGWYHEGKRKRRANETMTRLRNEHSYTVIDEDGQVKEVHPRRLRQWELLEHCKNPRGVHTRFFSNSPKYERILLEFDIDFKGNDSKGLKKTCMILLTLVLANQGYVEPSTNGHGYHIYFFVDVKYIQREKLKVMIMDIQKKLKQYLNPENLDNISTLDAIYGIPTIWHIVNGQYVINEGDRGNLVKFPFLTGRATREKSLKRLEHLARRPIDFNAWYNSLSQILEHKIAEKVSKTPLKPVRSVAKEKTPNTSTDNKQVPVMGNGQGAIPFSDCSGNLRMLSMDTQVSIEPVLDGQLDYFDFYDPDPKHRRGNVCGYLLRKNKGATNVSECMDLYHSLNLQTGMAPEDIAKRQVDMADTLAFKLRGYESYLSLPFSSHNVLIGMTHTKPLKNNIFEVLDLSENNIKTYVNKLEENIPLDALCWKRREKLSYENMAIFFIVKAYTIFYPKFTANNFGCSSRDVFINFCRKLKEEGQIKISFNNSTHKFYFDLLVKYGFLEVVEMHIPPTYSMHVDGWMITKGEKTNGIARRVNVGAPLFPQEHKLWMDVWNNIKISINSNVKETKAVS